MGSSAVRVLAIGAGTLAGLAAPGAALAAPQDPPGNNGTIKVDAVPFDDRPDNEPHVDCVFQIDFYGFDEGDLYADVVFEGRAPTGGGTLLTDRVFIGEDGDDGGGSTAGLDASVTYDLTDELAAIEPHAQQGWHVKLTIAADGSHGADTKHKVFWVDGCRPAPAVAPAAVPETTTTTAAPTTTTTTEAPTTTTTAPTTTSTTTAAVVEEEADEAVRGVSYERAPAAPVAPAAEVRAASDSQAAPSSLPRTGAAIALLTAIGASLVGLGYAVRRLALSHR
jgi:mRNA-degrading endonuclease toxin of MazEF toxin-antitoxin module